MAVDATGDELDELRTAIGNITEPDIAVMFTVEHLQQLWRNYFRNEVSHLFAALLHRQLALLLLGGPHHGLCAAPPSFCKPILTAPSWPARWPN